MKVIVPVKRGSRRVGDKNFRPFWGNRSLFDVKMEQLLRTTPPDQVYVSSESAEVESFSRRYRANFLLRPEQMADNDTPIVDVIRFVVAQVPGEDDIAWAQVTDPVFDEYRRCWETWAEVANDHDSMAVVKPLQTYILNERGEPVNYSFGLWHKISQRLPRWYTIAHTLSIWKRETVLRYGYYVAGKTYLYENRCPSIDIDTEEDFRLAAEIFSVIRRWREDGGANSAESTATPAVAIAR